MNEKWLKLAGELLEEASDTLSNNGCNDWKWPPDWSLMDRNELCVQMISDNTGRSPEEFNKVDLEELERMQKGTYGPPDWWIAAFLAGRMKNGTFN